MCWQTSVAETAPDGDGNADADGETQFREFLADEDRHRENVMTHVFNLNYPEVRTYLALRDNPKSTGGELTDELDRHLTSVRRSLEELCDRGLASKQKRPLETGGRSFIYTPASREKVVQFIREHWEEWAKQVQTEIETLEHHVQETG